MASLDAGIQDVQGHAFPYGGRAYAAYTPTVNEMLQPQEQCATPPAWNHAGRQKLERDVKELIVLCAY